MIGALLPYRAVLWLASPLLAGYTLWRGMRDGGALYCKQRLGVQMPAIEHPLWVHCASVGEVSAVLPLLKAIRDRHRGLPLLVTTNTPTSREVLLKQMADQVTHAYLPVDLYPG